MMDSAQAISLAPHTHNHQFVHIGISYKVDCIHILEEYVQILYGTVVSCPTVHHVDRGSPRTCSHFQVTVTFAIGYSIICSDITVIVIAGKGAISSYQKALSKTWLCLHL